MELRREKKYREEFARTERLYNSPVFYMRRILNNLSEEENTLEDLESMFIIEPEL